MTEEQSGSGTGTLGIDEPTAREMMGYYKISHDEFVKYVKNLGIDHED
jgi:hypothetical protein